jgi:filamentous hemagglutinin family protein
MELTIKIQLLTLVVLANFVPQQMMAGPATVPLGGNFTAGRGAISTSGNIITINQSSKRGIINWNNFSIGAKGIVSFQNGSGATLNLVNGGAISSILGSLLASGSVYLMNPQGVVIGSTGKVNTGGDFVASSLKVSNGAFMNGGSLLFKGSSGAIVKNLGEIASNGGSVFSSEMLPRMAAILLHRMGQSGSAPVELFC